MGLWALLAVVSPWAVVALLVGVLVTLVAFLALALTGHMPYYTRE